MVERLNLCLIDFRYLNSPEQRWHRPRCSSLTSKSAAPGSPSIPFPCGFIPPGAGNVFGSRRCDCRGTSFGSLWPKKPAGLVYRTQIDTGQRSGEAKRSHQGRFEIASRMPLKAPINADNRRYRSLDSRFEEFLRTRGAHVRLGDKGYPGINVG